MEKKQFATEREGQMAFFDNYGIPYADDASILVDNTDGVYNGNILEFKLNISNLGKVLFQAIKYLSKMRVKGESVPSTILLVDLDATTVYVYKTQKYFDEIHKIYTGAASKENDGFVAGPYEMALDYSDMTQSAMVKKILKGRKVNPDEMYMPIDIDENCIVGWAERYYREMPSASKGDFLGDDTGTAVKVIGEIRDPKHFKGLINPYQGKSNEKFKYLMDCLNDRLSKKDLGAFYTPVAYAKKASELVLMAVERVPVGNDYIILDRCAGTGNLEAALIGLTDKNGDDLIGHCVVSTYEYYEYKVLQERIGDMVRDIIPPTEANVVYESGKVANADAMSEEFINNPIIRQYVDNPKCTIILFENPPYFDSSSITYTENGDHSVRRTTAEKDSYVCRNFKAELKKYGSVQASARELSNLFIWSAKKYYLRQESDSYIVFSPVKYFKSVNLLSLHCEKAYGFNRRWFHASDSVISCILWSNTQSSATTWRLELFDIDKDGNIVPLQKFIDIRQARKSIACFNDKRAFVDDEKSNVVCNSDGSELVGWSHKTKQSVYNKNIIAYMAANGFLPDAKHRYLSRCGNRAGIEQSYGFMVRADNYLIKLPMWVAKMYPMDNWYDKDVYYNTSDGGEAYTQDAQFLKTCLIYTCLSNQNKCLSFDGADGRRYQNELCFDDSHTDMPLALRDLRNYAASKATALDDEEQKLLALWGKILIEAKSTAGYNPEFNYGVYQIAKELNTSHTVGTGKAKTTIYDYPVLNGYLDTLRVMLTAYYRSHITEKMFRYELLK